MMLSLIMIMVMIMLMFQQHQSTKCAQNVRFKLHVACRKWLLSPSKPKANVQNPFIAKLIPQQGNQLAHSIQKQKVKEMSFKKKFQDSLCQFLSRPDQLRDFLNVTKGLLTTGMHYDEEYVEFLMLLNMLYRSS